jgi:4-alpha-glucanotransferase
MMRGAWSSVADMAIVPMQDIIGLGSEARINTPSTLGTNWKWRATSDQITPALAKRLYRYMEMYGRRNPAAIEALAKKKRAKKK